MYNVPDEHIPSHEDLDRLYNGDDEIVNILIEGLIGFILNEIQWFIHNHPSLSNYEDDITSEALLTLTESVNNMVGKKFSPDKFINYIKKACVISVIRLTMKLQLPVTVPDGSLFNKGIRPKLDRIRETTTLVKKRDKQTAKDQLFGEIWFDDFINNLDTTDQHIIRMKLSGKSYSDIGVVVGIHKSQVKSKLERLLEIYNGKD